MAKNHCCFFLLFFFLMASSIEAQEKEPVETLDVLVATTGLGSLTSDSDATSEFSVDANNYIFIQQVGPQNRVFVDIKTDQSELNFTQQGTNNTIVLGVTALKADVSVNQYGSNHIYREYLNNSNAVIQRNFTQNGNGQKLEIYNSNSISEKMILNMSGQAKTIVIRNFN